MHHWEGIEEFIAVAEQQGFTAASRVLGVSKAHVSQQVSRLEARLGVKLLHRTTRNMALTDVGVEYLESCRALMDELIASELKIRQRQEEMSGRIRLSAPHLLSEVCLLSALTAFQEQYPQIDIDIELASQRVDLLESHFDVAIQLGQREEAKLVNRPLLTTGFHAVASPEYVERHGEPKHPLELQAHQGLLFLTGSSVKPWKFVDTDGRILSVAMRGKWRSNSGHFLRTAAKKGLGIAYLPSYYLKDDVKKGSLIQLLPQWTAVEREIVAVYKDKKYLPAKIETLIDFLQAYLQSENKWASGVPSF